MTKYKLTKIIKCPKCRSRVVNLIDYYVGHTVFFYCEEPGKYDEGNLEPGNMEKVFGECRACGHCWTLRGLSSATSQFEDISQ